MGDMFGKWVPDEWIEKVFASCHANQQWEYLFLTKFPQRYVGLQLPPTAWIGTTVDEQYRVKIAEEAFRHIDGVRLKWLSLEPLREDLRFNDLSMFDFVVLGSQSATEQPEDRMGAGIRAARRVGHAHNGSSARSRMPRLLETKSERDSEPTMRRHEADLGGTKIAAGGQSARRSRLRRGGRMTLILALDIATRTGFARGRVGELPVSGSINFGRDGSSRNRTDAAIFAAALRWLSQELQPEPRPDLVIMEAMLPPDAARGSTQRAVRDRLAGLQGIVKGVSHLRGIGEIAEATVGNIRGHFIGDRSLKRAKAKSTVMERCRALGWECADDNAGDALALWSYACALIDPTWALQVSPLFNRKLRVVA